MLENIAILMLCSSGILIAASTVFKIGVEKHAKLPDRVQALENAGLPDRVDDLEKVVWRLKPAVDEIHRKVEDLNAAALAMSGVPAQVGALSAAIVDLKGTVERFANTLGDVREGVAEIRGQMAAERRGEH